MLKARPLSRDKATFRDDRLFLVACDDSYAPKLYFDSFKLKRLQVKVITSQNGRCAARDVLESLKSYSVDPDDVRWLILDTDHYIRGQHLGTFTNALREASQSGVHVALSRPCFEIWLLLHHVEEDKCTNLKTAREVETALRQILGIYKKNRLDTALFSASRVRLACERARRMDALVKDEVIPSVNTSRVYLMWEQIFKALALDADALFP